METGSIQWMFLLDKRQYYIAFLYLWSLGKETSSYGIECRPESPKLIQPEAFQPS